MAVEIRAARPEEMEEFRRVASTTLAMPGKVQGSPPGVDALCL